MKQAILVFQAKQPTKSVKQMFAKDTITPNVRPVMRQFQTKCANQVRPKNISVKLVQADILKYMAFVLRN